MVQYATNANGPFSTFVDGVSAATTATVTGLVNTTAYVFRVAAVNTAGTGSWSSLSGATPLGAPSAPSIGSITVGSSYLQVPFTAPVDNGGAAVTGYQYSLDGGTWTTAATSTSPITITGLTNGQAYAVRLRAVNSVGGGAASTPVSATPFGMPAAVQGFRATPTANSVTLEWDTADDNGSPITAYNLIRWSAMTAGSIAQSFPITTTSHTVTGLGAGTYYFTIEATNAAGTGPRSTPRTTAIVGGTVPAAPTVSTVTLTDGDLAMSWTAGAANTSPITSYIVQYSTDGSTWTTASSGSSATSAAFALPTGAGSPSVRVAAVSATGVSAFGTVELPVAGPTIVSAVTSSSATVSGGIDPNGLDATIAFEFADTLGELGTVAATTVAATPGTANGSDVVPVTADLSGLDPGHEYVVRLVVSGSGVTTNGVAAPFTTDAVITTSDLEFDYTGSPVEPVTTVLPYGLSLTRTFVGTGDTTYSAGSTAPTEVGTYEMTTVSADPAIGGEEVVTITIAPKPITVTIDALDNTYDGTTVALLSFELDGVVVGDDVEANPSAVFGDLVDPGAGEKTVVLEYELMVDRVIGADAHNYDAGYVEGDLVVTIGRASQTLAFTSTAPAQPTTGSTYHPTATSSAGLTPVIAIGAGAGTVCTIAAATGELRG